MPDLPRFFYPGALTENSIITLDADTAKHIWQVLRMKEDDELLLTDGKGSLARGVIHIAERHKCDVAVKKVTLEPRKGAQLHLCVGFTKNNSRNEWLLEKATELGVASITPLSTSRSERSHIRFDRWDKILQSAILQSQQNYLPQLNNGAPLAAALKQFKDIPNKLVAHCYADLDRAPISEMLKNNAETVLLIGPEGDFTPDEVTLCEESGFTSVSLGGNRLRTETAAIAAAAFFNMMSDGKN